MPGIAFLLGFRISFLFLRVSAYLVIFIIGAFFSMIATTIAIYMEDHDPHPVLNAMISVDQDAADRRIPGSPDLPAPAPLLYRVWLVMHALGGENMNR